ncbi:TPA: hypothetical protein L9L56_004470 [Klebsiella pneumoniae]|uniref:hypothetical protein n=1 Tax=Klebsiella pneumoniae TaxID=573 RepID=UPI000E2FDB80|nr:hypothetical protein [Klebsiella pneumoniae]HBR1366646.1 hypothetical protein [Klebsiella pneumoniae]HBR2015027.1 hypothetical protein [Klebsiella pneumoniae]
MTTIKSAGYIAFSDEAIYGTGLTAQAALDDAKEWADDVKSLSVAPATAALIEAVNNGGATDAYGIVNGVRCTEAEEEAAEAINTTKFLMNPLTGSVDTEENWLAEMPTWDEDPAECRRQFDTLIEVVKDAEGNWIEAE